MYDIVRDYNKALEQTKMYLDKWEKEGTIKYATVEKVKIKNPLTKAEQTVKDLFFVAFNDGSEKPMCVMGVHINNTDYILHEDITHYNMSTGRGCYNITSKEGIIYKTFCNPVLMHNIWNDSNTASKILKGNLMEGNPNDSYRTISSVDVDKDVHPLYDKYTREMFKQNSTLEQIVTGYHDRSRIKEEDVLKLNEVITQLRSSKDLCYAYVAYSNNPHLEFEYKVVNKKDIENGKYITSNYYKIYTAKNIDESIEVKRIEKDICCIGLGSAGSNIIDQLVKLNYFNSIVLIDFDTVERKNLRNQMYDTSDIGSFKTEGMRKFINYYKLKEINVTKYDNKFEETPIEMYKFKYLVSGFDSIECRLDVLNKIKEGKIETEYLIDARYKDLDSSLFIINTSNKEEIEYYENLLLEDKKELEANKEEPIESREWTIEDADMFARKHHIYDGRCAATADELGFSKDTSRGYYNICHFVRSNNCSVGCKSEECKECIKEALEIKGIVNEYYESNSCLHSNIIHIYKMTSSWVTSAIRSIETDNKKYFTHVDITVDPIPNAIVLKK